MKNKPQHTPGPWVLHEGGTAVNGADGALVASCGSLPYRNVWDSRANARLIAAAPDLLEALIEIEQMVHAGEINEGTMEIVALAINKAQGQS